MTLTGMWATLSAPRSFSPWTTRRRAGRGRAGGVGESELWAMDLLAGGEVTGDFMPASVPKLTAEFVRQPIFQGGDLLFPPGHPAQIRHRQPGMATGVDALEGLQIHVHIQGQPMKAAASPHPQPQLGQLGAIVRSEERRVGKECRSGGAATR